MDQPVFWSVLAAAVVLALAARLVRGRPLPLARAVGRGSAVVAGLCALALVFHCGAMFFGPWVDAVPGARGPADAVRAMGTASRWAYVVPSVLLALALRRVWWPALATLVVCLAGVGVTMYGPYPLDTHLAWLAAIVLTTAAVGTGLVLPTRTG